MKYYKVYGMLDGWKIMMYINASNKAKAKEKALLTGNYDEVNRIILE